MSLLQGNTGTDWQHTVSPVLGGMSDLNIPYANLNNHEQSSGANFVDYGLMGYPSEAQRALLLSGVHQSAVGGLAPPGDHVLALKNLLQGNYMSFQGYPAGRRKGSGPATGPAVNPLYKVGRSAPNFLASPSTTIRTRRCHFNADGALPRLGRDGELSLWLQVSGRDIVWVVCWFKPIVSPRRNA